MFPALLDAVNATLKPLVKFVLTVIIKMKKTENVLNVLQDALLVQTHQIVQPVKANTSWALCLVMHAQQTVLIAQA